LWKGTDIAEGIQFDNEKDRLRALEALDEADETYQCIPPRHILLARATLAMLRSRGIPVHGLGRQPEGPDHGSCP
jgi:hypothetical protein